MSYILSDDLFVRQESYVDDESNVFIFVGKSGRMFQCNQSVLDILDFLKQQKNIETIVNDLAIKYSKSPKEQIRLTVNKVITEFQDFGIIEKID